MKNNNSVEIAVINDDVASVDSDVLILKYAQAHFGLDRFISQKLIRLGVDDTLFSPLPGIANYFNSRGGISARNVLIVGVKPLYDFNYKDIRSFARTALESLSDQEASIQHVCLTLHGANYGLDEIEAFESEVTGLIDGITGGCFPKEIRKISIIEIDKKRADRLNKTLTELIPKGYIEVNLKSYLRDVKQEVSEKFRLVQEAAQLKFDVRSQRCIVYTRIKELEEKLHNELISLKYATID